MWYVDFYCYVRLPEATVMVQQNKTKNNCNNPTAQQRQATTSNKHQATNCLPPPIILTAKVTPKLIVQHHYCPAILKVEPMVSHCPWEFVVFFSRWQNRRGFFWWGKCWILKAKPSNPGYFRRVVLIATSGHLPPKKWQRILFLLGIRVGIGI